jgi:vancomycin permeability regulator SanA
MQSPKTVSADVFVILGAAVKPDNTPSGAMRRRVKGAIAMGTSVQRPIYIVTGGKGRYGDAEACVMRDLLIECGVVGEAVVLESQAYDTLSSIVNCASLIKTMSNVRSVTICTDSYHMLRCKLLFFLVGINAKYGSMPSGRKANGLPRWFFYYVRELLAIPYDVTILFFRRYVLVTT